VLRHIRELIVTGGLSSGEYVRLEPIAAYLEVSVTPVREALMQLCSEGLVVLHPRRGFRVVPLSADDIADIYLVQAFIASELVRRAARRLSPSDLDQLDEVQHELEVAHGEGNENRVAELNYDFHRTLNLAADAPRLAQMLHASTQFAPRLFFAQIEGWPAASATEHREIIAAIRSGDVDRAARAMNEHVVEAGRLLAQHVEQRRSTS
jgi:DNA-binding GntR family transcriptional regulator